MDSEERKLLVQALPKAELHCHIEGTLEPEMMLRLAGINQVDLPYSDISKIKAAYAGGCRAFDSAIRGLGGCPMAKDELTGNVPTEKLLSFLSAQKAQNIVNMLYFESAYNSSFRLC